MTEQNHVPSATLAPGGSVLKQAEHIDVSIEDSRKLRKRLVKLADNIAKSYMDFAELLWDAHRSRVGGEPLWKSWGYESFNDFAQTELGMARSKAHYFVQIWGELQLRVNLNRADIERIGWSKAKELASLTHAGVLTVDNAKDWIDFAENNTLPVLVDAVKRAKNSHRLASNTKSDDVADTDDDADTNNVTATNAPPVVDVPLDSTEKLFRLTVPLFEEQYENVLRAMDMAEKVTDSKKKGNLLDLICTEYIANNIGNGAGNRKKTLQRMSAMMERIFGVKVAAFDKNTDDILVGKDLIE